MDHSSRICSDNSNVNGSLTETRLKDCQLQSKVSKKLKSEKICTVAPWLSSIVRILYTTQPGYEATTLQSQAYDTSKLIMGWFIKNSNWTPLHTKRIEQTPLWGLEITAKLKQNCSKVFSSSTDCLQSILFAFSQHYISNKHENTTLCWQHLGTLSYMIITLITNESDEVRALISIPKRFNFLTGCYWKTLVSPHTLWKKIIDNWQIYCITLLNCINKMELFTALNQIQSRR